MSERASSFFILVPGPWQDDREVRRALNARKISALDELQVDVVEDSELALGFRSGRGGPLDEQLLENISECSRAALIECPFRLQDSAVLLAQLGRALRDAGGLAVRMEGSGAASAWQPWLEHLDAGDIVRLYECAVLLVEADDGGVFTCGMQQFDLPDAQIEMEERGEALAWLDAFNIYQLAEQPALVSGHTFRPSVEVARRTLERWPDHRHASADGRHNPFGLWRFLEPGATGVAVGRTVPVMIPALVAILHAAERSAKRALTASEVDAIVRHSSAVAMDPKDVAAIERSRGYADIEPERAWEQWQIVRTGLTA